MFSDNFPLDVSKQIYGLCRVQGLETMFKFSLLNQKTNQIASKDLNEIGKSYEKLSGFRGNYAFQGDWFDPYIFEVSYRVLFNKESFELVKIEVETPQEDSVIRITLGEDRKEEVLWKNNTFLGYLIPGISASTVYIYTQPINKIEFIHPFKEKELTHLISKIELLNSNNKIELIHSTNKIKLIPSKEDAEKIDHLEMVVELMNRKILSDHKKKDVLVDSDGFSSSWFF